MPRPSPTTDPELKAHREWLGYLQPVGLVVAPAAMLEAGWVVTRSGSELIERQERYREAIEPLAGEAESDDSDSTKGFRSLAELLTDHLGWDPEQLDTGPETIAAHTKELPELGETLKPTAVVPAAAGEGDQLLVIELPLGAAFDQKTTDGEHLWRASAQERLLRETGVEAGLLFNGQQLRLVFDGGGPTTDYLPARHGQLFNPAEYPWLETPWISDGVVLAVLRNLLIVNGERISYRALDVEQIGSVYEGIMGYAVRRIPGRCIGLKSKPQGAKKQITTAVDLDALLALPGGKRKAWLEEEAGTTLPTKAANALKAAGTEAELLEALAPRIDRNLFDGPQAAGSLVFQPTEERRRSGSHYTPRSLTRPIVVEALRPWLERCGGKPTVAQILALKICDPAMGSGAFLVECCRYLAELLEQAWAREGLPDALKPGGSAHGEEPLIYARRLIAQSCLYGVDKNPFAVNLARLSLWLVSLSKDAPFTFVDHALKCGDSLVGMERSEIEKALKGASLQRELQIEYLEQVRQQEARSFALFHADSRSDADDAQKRQALDELNASTAYLRTVGDLLVAAFFNGKKPKDRDELKQLYLAATLQHSSADELKQDLAEPLERLHEGEKGIQPLHWQLAFPDVFGRPEPGFDVFVGNPPFVGGRKMKEALGESFQNWLQDLFPESSANADLSAFFFLRCFNQLRPSGSLGLIATNTIAQGDTRSTGLRWICLHGGTIYAARKRCKWPGVAAVVVSVVHIIKTTYSGAKTLDLQPADQITAYLFNKGCSNDPKPLAENAGKSFQGSIPLGMGFTFEDCETADYETVGEPTPIQAIDLITAKNPDTKDALFPFIGYAEVATHPSHQHHQYVIDFRDSGEEECRSRWPELMSIVEAKVKPERTRKKPNGDYCLRSPLPQRWWQHADKRPALYSAAESAGSVLLAGSQASAHFAFAWVKSQRIVYSSNLTIIFANGLESIVLSRVHEIWSRFFTTTIGDGFTYAPTKCFEPYPFPGTAKKEVSQTSNLDQTDEILNAASKLYVEFRAELMVSNNEGLTSTYNRFHDPAETSTGLLELRRLHGEMDQAVLAAYGWSDVSTACGFGLDYLDTEDNAQLPDELQERIDSGELFFWDANDALDFQSQLQAYGAITGRRKLPWRYRWPDAVRDDVLARLLALNAERYAEEMTQGLHGKGGKKTASDPAAGGKRRGRPAKGSNSADTGQIGLAL